MTKEVLQMNSDGTQEVVQKELPSNWNDPSPPPPPTLEDQIAELRAENQVLSETLDIILTAVLPALTGV